MNSIERLRCALSGQQPDRVPVMGLSEHAAVTETARFLGIEVAPPPGWQARDWETIKRAELRCQIAERLGVDDVKVLLYVRNRTEKADRPPAEGDTVFDKFGSTYVIRHGLRWIVDGPIKSLADVQGYDLRSRLDFDDFVEAQHVMDRVGQEKACVLQLEGPFKLSWSLRGGMEKALQDLVVNPSLVDGIMRVATDFLMEEIEMAAKMKIEFLFLGGDLADERSTIMSPRHYREHVKPYHKEIVDLAHHLGMKIIKHSDGNASAILDDFVEIGFDGFHPIQSPCMDIAEVKRRYGGRICLVGNIDGRFLLPYGTSEAVDEAVRKCIAVASPGGGHILAPGPVEQCKPENYIAMVEAARKYGAYQDK